MPSIDFLNIYCPTTTRSFTGVPNAMAKRNFSKCNKVLLLKFAILNSKRDNINLQLKNLCLDRPLDAPEVGPVFGYLDYDYHLGKFWVPEDPGTPYHLSKYLYPKWRNTLKPIPSHPYFKKHRTK